MKIRKLQSIHVEQFFTGVDSGKISYYKDEKQENINDIDISFEQKPPTDQNSTEEKAYENGTLIEITEEQGWLMISEAERIRNNPDEKYNLYLNNCGQNANKIVVAGNEEYGETN